MWLLLVVALIFPRIAAVALFLFTRWFEDVFTTVHWPVLGFLFAPYTMLWYSVVVNWFAGAWGPLQIVGLAAAIVIDVSQSSMVRR